MMAKFLLFFGLKDRNEREGYEFCSSVDRQKTRGWNAEKVGISMWWSCAATNMMEGKRRIVFFNK
jgi:hypothetical protein